MAISSTKTLRLQKYIADSGFTSRRKAESLIAAGKVKLNGKTVTRMGLKVDPAVDVISVDGKIVHRDYVDKLYILFHKPRAVVTTLSDPEGRKTVMDFFPMIKERIYPVGRLDYHSEGLLLLTNDGEMAHRVMHPSFEIIKVYEVKVFGAVGPHLLKNLKRERLFPEGPVRPRSVRVIRQLPGKTWLEFRLSEGRNREIRRLCESAGLTIDKLKRVAVGGLCIQSIAPGEFCFLSRGELEKKLGMRGKEFEPFVSQKRTIDVRRKGGPKGVYEVRAADDPYFLQYRKQGPGKLSYQR
ncbi:MAG: pseudouridine synthase [Bacteriovoracales bacterium]|nr:pseudouridine synthase [Bacteriovoracales bacterium]